MKPFLVIVSSFLLCSCADMYVSKTYVSTGASHSRGAVDGKDFGSTVNGVYVEHCGVGASNPKAIYIRPFCIDTATVRGDVAHSAGEVPIRVALTPIDFAADLKEQLEKLAPARILKDDEQPNTGWLVEGSFDLVDGGSPAGRFFLGHFGAGRSFLALHVKVTDVEAGAVVYEFDVAGGSRLQGKLGTVRASGLGKAVPFDLKNAAERILLTLSVDPFRYGARSDVSLR
jgi:hypothetical protein